MFASDLDLCLGFTCRYGSKLPLARHKLQEQYQNYIISHDYYRIICVIIHIYLLRNVICS